MTTNPQIPEYDVIAVGDTAIDDFIRLGESSAIVANINDQPQLAVPYGGKIAFENSTTIYGVGNAANACVNFAKLGLKTALISNVGNDDRGRKVLATLERKRVDTEFVKLQHGKRTNYHYILWYKNDRTILTNHENYRYHWPHLTNSEIPKWIYLTSLAEDTLDYHAEILDWIDKNPDVKLAFQPGTYQIKTGASKLKAVYQRSHVVVLNREEAVKVTGASHENVHDLLDRMHQLGPRLVMITDGAKGSYASDGSKRFFMPVYPDVAPPVERTGCGDAYTSTFVSALIKGYDIQGALQLAPITPASVVLYPGSQEGLLTMREIKEWLERAPATYKAEEMK